MGTESVKIGDDLPLAARTATSCRCGEQASGDPELDARLIPHSIRHGAIFGALDSVPGGSAMIVAAPHDPLPLLAQIRKRYADAVDVSYVEDGPEVWRVRLAKRVAG